MCATTQYVTRSVNNTIRPYFSAKFNFLVNVNTIILRNVLNAPAKCNKICKRAKKRILDRMLSASFVEERRGDDYAIDVPVTLSHFAKSGRIVLQVNRRDLRRYNVTFSFRAMTTVGRQGSKSINPLNGPFFLPLPPPLTGNTTLPTAAIHRDTLWHS